MPGGPRVSDSAIERDRISSLARYHANRAQNQKAQKHYRDRQFESRVFIGWDGEGYTDDNGDHHYMLFGASTGDCITGRSLGTSECLRLILDVERKFPDTYHVGFAFEYDVNMILKDMPWRGLALLKEQGYCRWDDEVTGEKYKVEHVPHKWLRITCKGASATIFDVFGFFHCSYIAALGKYDIGNTEKRGRISAGKSARGLFTYSDIASVTEYWTDEISLLPDLMDKVRTAVYSGGYRISEWHGPGALAAFLLRDVGVNKWHSKDSTPTEVKIATRYAYAGGRFSPFLCGLYLGPVYTADLNSAYVYACSLLPRMDKGRWRRQNGKDVDPRKLARFGLYHLEFDAGQSSENGATRALLPEPPYPLFHRDKDGTLRWPRKTRGWYWTPEAELLAGSSSTRILEAWIFSDDGTYPFRFVQDAYARRVELQHDENPAEKAYKWALAAMYGAFARRVGWDRQQRKAPRSHELAWAGWITSWCRANVWGPAMDAYVKGKGRGLISIDTDGITSTVPFDPEKLPNGVGEGLGQWKLEEFTGILQWQNGIYWLRNSKGEWKDPKSRGLPRGSVPFDTAMAALASMDYTNHPFTHPALILQRTRFIGFHQAIRGQFDKWRKWVTEEVQVTMGGSASGKALHYYAKCLACRMTIAGDTPATDTLESLHTITSTMPRAEDSQPHKLPWLEEQPELHPGFVQDDVIPIVKDGDM